MKKGKIMKYIKTAVLSFVLAVLFTATSAFAAGTQPVLSAPTGQWSLSLDGSGGVTTATPSKFNGSLGLELGHTGNLILPWEVGVRQGFGYGAADGSSNWRLSTHLYSDWTLVKLGNLEFDAGVNAGASYGNNPLVWDVAPEAVVRLWLLSDGNGQGIVNTFLRGDYPFQINEKGLHAENDVRLTVGLNIRFK